MKGGQGPDHDVRAILADRANLRHSVKGACLLVSGFRLVYLWAGGEVLSLDADPSPLGVLVAGRCRGSPIVRVGVGARVGPLLGGTAVPYSDRADHPLHFRRYGADSA